MSKLAQVTHLAQVAVISRDLESTMRAYVEQVGIGPWAVLDFAGPELVDMELRGQSARFTARLAIAWTNGLMWEIIEPGEGRSIYSEFLEQHGEGMHHVLVRHDAPDMDAFIDEMKGKGCPVIMSMTFKGTRFAYVDCMASLKLIIEVVQRAPGQSPRANRPASEPEYWYPAPPAD